MPFFDLKCKKCNSEFNIMATMSQKENKQINCPQCGSNDLETVFKNINVIKNTPKHSCGMGCHGCPHN